MRWPFHWVPDPRSIEGVPLALQAGGQIDRPHWTSFLGLRLVQWGGTFEAHMKTPPDHPVVLTTEAPR